MGREWVTNNNRRYMWPERHMSREQVTTNNIGHGGWGGGGGGQRHPMGKERLSS